MSSGVTEVRDWMAELKNVKLEYKRLSLQTKAANARCKELERKILTYLEKTERPGLKYQDITVLRTESNTRTRKKKAEKDQSAIKILEEAGVEDPEATYKIMIESQKGDKTTVSKLKVEDTIPEID